MSDEPETIKLSTPQERWAALFALGALLPNDQTQGLHDALVVTLAEGSGMTLDNLRAAAGHMADRIFRALGE